MATACFNRLGETLADASEVIQPVLFGRSLQVNWHTIVDPLVIPGRNARCEPGNHRAARILGGMDSQVPNCAPWFVVTRAAGNDKLRSISAKRHTSTFPPRKRDRVLIILRPKRAWGMPGAERTHSLVRKDRKHTS
jgi:hypothetical protein